MAGPAQQLGDLEELVLLSGLRLDMKGLTSSSGEDPR